jgi:type I restriction-modification system DNA methylase subunit
MTVFEKNITSLHFHFKGDSNEGGVILTHDFLTKASSLSPQELFALETAINFKADAVYFRYFDDGRASIPQIYIFDNTEDHLSSVDIAKIHKRIWSGCQIPVFVVVQKTSVEIYDAREKVKEFANSITTDPIETVKLAGDAYKKFSALQFETGLYWEEKNNENRFQFGTSAYKDLIEGLKRVYSDFQVESELDPHVALKLLVQCLLIKYLEERDEESMSGYFAKTFFKNQFGASDFCDVIRKGKLLDLLDKLSENFNGKIFEWNTVSERTARNSIRRAKVKALANYLDGNVINQQYVLWRLYSFSHLPVELISSVYEELLGKGKKDTVYTPDVIASTLIDECMPLRKPQFDFKLIDISCGSGIFLVKAYKRIVQWWRYNKWKETGELQRPDLETLKSLLVSSIYGVDIQSDAVGLSIFSLALALLDELDPKTIWSRLKFEDLGAKNILAEDFFKFITESPQRDFDLVIGNPPFNPPNNISNGDYYKSLNNTYNYFTRFKVPDHNLAIIFLTEAIRLLKPNGLLCLIQPSGPLMYQEDTDLKRELFTQYNLLQVLDFTKLGDVLWGKATIATAAIFLQNSLPDERAIAHVIVERTPANLKKLFLELDHYNFHFFDKSTLLNSSYVWKANAFGGARILKLINKLRKARTLKQFLKEKGKDGWACGEGFIESKVGKTNDNITGKLYLPAKALTEEGIDWKQTSICTVKKFHRPTNKMIYTPPHILWRANISSDNLIVHLSNKYLVFRNKIIGIHAPKKDLEKLTEVQSYLLANSDILKFYILATSSQLKVNRHSVPMTEDLMNVPYPNNISDIRISKAERILINDLLEYHSGKAKEIFEDDAEVSDLKAFCKVFCKTLNTVYSNSVQEFHLFKILVTDSYYGLHFNYGTNQLTQPVESIENIEEYLHTLAPLANSNSKGTHIQRILKLYAKDTIVLIKPRKMRYWLQSIALRDADETFNDYLNAGF